MMDYFETKERLNNLIEFRRLYVEYISFTNRPHNPAGEMVRSRMQPLLPLTVESLRKVGLGGMITRDAPVHGGKKVRINLIKAIFRDQVIKRFSLDDTGPLQILDKGVVKYQKRLWQQKVQLFNPIFWLFQFGSFLAKLPFHIARAAGYDTDPAEKLALVKVYLVLFQLAYFYALFKTFGVFDWVRIDILAL